MHHVKRRAFFLGALCISMLSATGCTQTEIDAANKAYMQGNFADALAGYRRAAEKGDADAQFNLAMMYFEGQGAARNFTEAARWYQKSAEQGNMLAQNNLAAMYMDGKGVPRDMQEAAFWFGIVANKGDTYARILRDRAAAELTPAQQDAVRTRILSWKPGDH